MMNIPDHSMPLVIFAFCLLVISTTIIHYEALRFTKKNGVQKKPVNHKNKFVTFLIAGRRGGVERAAAHWLVGVFHLYHHGALLRTPENDPERQ